MIIWKQQRNSLLILLITFFSLSDVFATSNFKNDTSYLPQITNRNGKLYTTDNQIFTPRGVNYIRLNGSQGTKANLPVYHSTFSPKYYEGNRSYTENMFQKLHLLKFNIVRVFIDVGTLNRFDGINGNGTANIPLNAMYLDNVADFIKISSKYGIYVVPTLDWIPQNNYFMTKCNVEEEAKATNLEFPNVQYMSEKCVNAKAEYVKIFLDGLKDRVSMKLLNTIAWISITNEAYYSTGHLPFSSKSINVTTSSNNKTYDMANPNDRQMCANENALYYVNIVKMHVEKEYENILITIGLFTYFAVGKTIQENYGLLPLKNIDNRFPFLPNALLTSKSKINLLDQHIYHTPGWSMKKDLESVEWKSLNFSKNCVVMGEFGAFKVPVVFPTPEAAAIAMKNQQIESCNLYNFSGWLFWTFDTFEQPFLWNMKSNDYIRDVLSPLNRPSACDDDMIKDKNEAKRYNKCRKLYANRSACNNDNVTFGGCVWCDIVDQPPFCTEIYIAKAWPHPPQFPPWRCDKNITNGLQNES